jgi:hypothetical protein
MKKIKTNTLTGWKLSYAVGMAENLDMVINRNTSNVPAVYEMRRVRCSKPGCAVSHKLGVDFNYENVADNIIDRERINAMFLDADIVQTSMGYPRDRNLHHGYFTQHAYTRREAAMKTWVLFKLGEEVEFPDWVEA